jgi:hypothetical protein
METTSPTVSIPAPKQDLLTHVLRQGAQKMLAQATRERGRRMDRRAQPSA